MSRLFLWMVIIAMSIVTALKRQKHSQRRINIYLDGAFAFGLAVRQADGLRVGQDLSQVEIATLQAADDVEKVFEKAVNYISYQPRTETEVQRRLEKAASSQEVIETVMVRLRETRMVDDKAFAEFWVDNRTTFRPRGHRALRAELRKKGVDPEIIDEAVSSVDETAAAIDAAKSRAPRLAHLPLHEFRHKLRTFLGRRGFDYDVTVMVVNQIITEQNETDL